MNLRTEDIVNQTQSVRNGLCALRDDHYNVLNNIRDGYENARNSSHNNNNNNNNNQLNNQQSLLEDRLNHVTKSLEDLEIGIEESSVILSLNEHFERIESDRNVLRLEMSRISDENDWLREELTDTQRKLQEAYAELTELQEEKRKWEFQEELKNISENNVRPITPSKIPVGNWRVEEEKAINLALDPNSVVKKERSASPAPSRLPVGAWRSKLSTYSKVMEKKDLQEKSDRGARMNKRSYFKLNAPATKIPSR